MLSSNVRSRLNRPLPEGVEGFDESRVPAAMLDDLRHRARRGEWPFYFRGDVGRGKSFTAAAIYLRWNPSSSARWMSAVDFFDRGMTVSKEGHLGIYVDGVFCEYSRESWWRGLANIGLLVIDEIGSGSANDWRNELLWKLLETRKGKPLILTGNLSLNELSSKFDSRIQSRILSGSIIEFSGRDLRTDGMEKRSSRVSLAADPPSRSKQKERSNHV